MSKLERFSEEAILENSGFNLKKRTVAIVVAENELSLSQKNLSQIVCAVKEGIISSQSNPVVLNVATVCDDLTVGTAANRYALPMRSSVANTVESYGSHTNIEGFVFVANQPITIAGMLEGALRVNKPCLFVCGGYMPTASFKEKRIGFNQSYSLMGQTRTGELSADDLDTLRQELITAFACSSDSYYANSGNIMVEAAGFALHGNSTLPSNAVQRTMLARKTGERIVKMIDSIITPSMMFNAETLQTILVTDLALGSSSTSILNILALAKCQKIKLNLNAISELAKKVPYLFPISEEAQLFMEDFANAGGVYGLLRNLEKSGLITAKHTAYSNQPLSTLISKNPTLIVPNASSKRTPLRIVNGNLADDGAVAFAGEASMLFSGRARVYNGEEAAFDAIANREVQKGNVLVIRGEGPSSAPGMREVRLPIALLKGLGLDKEVAVITDGRAQNISRGILIANVSPENCDDKGTLHLVQDGDTINIDLTKGKVTLDVSGKDLAKRKKLADCKKPETTNYLKRYAESVSSASEGALVP